MNSLRTCLLPLVGQALLLGLIPVLPGASRAASPALTQCPPRGAADQQLLIDPTSLGRLERCLNQLTQTRVLHHQRDGYSPQRVLLHQRILAAIRAQARCVPSPERPIAVFTAGPPGAGKSRWLSRHIPALMQPGWLRIDADALREQLPEYQGWNASQTQSETGDLVNELLGSIGKPCRTNVIYDGTLTSPKRYLDLIPKLKQLGYGIFIVQVMVPEDISTQRALERYRQTGRYVPNEAIESYFKMSAKTYELLKSRVDGTVQVDGLTDRIVAQEGTPLPLLTLEMSP